MGVSVLLKPFRGAFLGVCALALVSPNFAQAKELPDFTGLVEANAPSVVNISTQQKAKANKAPHAKRNMPNMPNMPDFPEGSPFGEWFKRYFGEEGNGGGDGGDGEGNGNGDEGEGQSLGSGFIISKDGFLLTNNHVIANADKIIVRLNDRREFEAKLIGRDERSDIALLHIEATDLPAVAIGQGNDLKVGEWVLAIGSPFGFDYSVTAGIVSAKGRSLPRENYVPFIQTDVAINPGNSGGPLFNLKGEVVGINSQIYSRTGGYMGVSFAIPIDVAMAVADQLKSKGKVTRGWLGVLIQDVTRELAESFSMEKPRGALVAQVLPDSPASEAGFQVGDVVVKFNGKDIDHSSDLPPLVGVTAVLKKVPVDIIRSGKPQKLMVKIGELPEEDDVKLASKGPENGNGTTDNRLGVVVADITKEQRDKLEIGPTGGIVVKDIKRGPAADAGMRRGDVIMIVNNVNVESVKQFKQLVKDLPTDKSVPVLVNRRGSPVFLAMRAEKE